MKLFPRSRRWRVVVSAGLLLPVLWLSISLAFVYVLTRRPHALFAEPAPVVAWGKLEGARFETSDGETLGAWLHRGSEDRPSVLLLHGNRGCRRDCLPAAEFFASRGSSVLLVSLRAHGDSSGDFNDFGFSAKRDVVAAVDFLEKERPGLPILIQGTSLGAAAAIFASGELGKRVHGYLLESPYRDLHQAVRNRLEHYLPPMVDRVAYTGVTLVGPLILPDAERIAPIEHIAGIPATVPVVILCGGADDRARPFEAKELHDRIAGHSRLVVFERAKHECLLRADGDCYRHAVEPLLEAVARQKG